MSSPRTLLGRAATVLRRTSAGGLPTPAGCGRVAIGLVLLTGTGCQTLLDIQQAEVDPSLEADPDDTPPPKPAPPPSTPPTPNEPDAAADDTSSAPEAECVDAFDNRRVKRLNSDGTLPPLPDAPSTPESQ